MRGQYPGHVINLLQSEAIIPAGIVDNQLKQWLLGGVSVMMEKYIRNIFGSVYLIIPHSYWITCQALTQLLLLTQLWLYLTITWFIVKL